MERSPEPRTTKVSVPLPCDEALSPDIRRRLRALPPLNNLRMFANVPQCFMAITDLINALFHDGKIDPKLREIMYLRIASKYGLLYEYRHNLLFSEQLGMSGAEIAAVTSDGATDGLNDDGKLVCKAAEEITANISISDPTLEGLLNRFGIEGTSEIILLVSWFNLLIRYVESTRVPYEPDPAAIISGGAPLTLKSP